MAKDRATVANTLRLLKLPVRVRNQVAAGQLSMGHARALLGLTQAGKGADDITTGAGIDGPLVERMAERVLHKGLSVRQTEELVRRERAAGDGRAGHAGQAGQAGQAGKNAAKPNASAGVRDLQTRLERALGTKVRIEQKTRAPDPY